MKHLFLILVMAFVFVGTINAAVKEGDKELNISGNYLFNNIDYSVGGSTTTGTSENFSFGACLGVFVTDEIELSIQGQYLWGLTKTKSGGSTTKQENDTYFLGGNCKYHFLTQNTVVPYVGYQANFAYTEFTSSGGGSSSSADFGGLMHGPLVGAKFFANENTTFFLEYQALLYAGDTADYFENGSAIMFGISWLF